MAGEDEDAFLTVANMRSVMVELEGRMERRHWDAVQGNPRMLVFEVMRGVSGDPECAGMSVAGRNAVAAGAAWDVLRALAAEAASAPPPPPAEEVPPMDAPAADLQRLMLERGAPPPTGDALAGGPADGEPANGTADADTRASVRLPWAPPRSAATTDYDLSLDGFERDTHAHPSRFSWTHACGDNLRSVTSLRLTTVSVPVGSASAGVAVGAPYVLLFLDEFAGAYDEGASSTVRRSFCKLVVDKVTGFPGGRQYARLVPDSGAERRFNPPLARLTRLTVSLRLPDGDLVSDAQDTHRIVDVQHNTDAAANWIVQTEARWVRDFQPGDVVRFSGVDTGQRAVDAFMNRKEGHVILAQGNDLEFLTPRATFVIPRPRVPDADGVLVEDVDARAALLRRAGTRIDGAVINTSLQASVSMVATCAQSVRHEAVL